MKLHAEVRRLIETGPLAHLVTLNADGSPQVTLVWIGLDGDTVVSGHLYKHHKLTNIERDPRVAISLEADTKSDWGLSEYVVLYGTAKIHAGGAPALLSRLSKVYMGQDAIFPPMPDPPPGFITRVEVDRIAGVGPWTGRPV